MILGDVGHMPDPDVHAKPDLICFSHLRWNFVFQRPQHLLTRSAKERRVYYIEEPLPAIDGQARLEIQETGGVRVVVPHVPDGAPDSEMRGLVDQLLNEQRIEHYVLWYYTPMALAFTDHLAPEAVVYDCMDELSAFANAPAELREREAQLLQRADLVFTGGQSLYEAKRHAHPHVHPFPSSVDVDHFARARRVNVDPPDQRLIPAPRLGFFGVVDERMDLDLLAGVATARPTWQLVIVGPVVKIDPAVLPRLSNIHYLGSKSYTDLPEYIAGWDVALLPFARNQATRYISPTKTPEYLAAGKPVVSTSITDVVRPYGQQGLVRIADTVDAFVRACEDALREDATVRTRNADVFLRETSWDGTWARMRHLMESVFNPNIAGATAAGTV
jgi:glycosyltransferase involved in cell wall biosynthesis